MQPSQPPMQSRLAPVLRVAALLALTAPAFAGKLFQVDPNTGPYTSIQAAVDAAADGDVIHVASGLYAEEVVIDGKALVLTGAENAIVNDINTLTPPSSALTIRNVPAGKRVVVAGLRLRGYGSGGTHALLVEQCAGSIRVEGTSLHSENEAVRVFASTDVVLNNVDIKSVGHDFLQSQAFAGLRAEAGSRVFVSHAVLIGSTAGHVSASLGVPTAGGDALLAIDSEVWVASSQLKAGIGGSIQVGVCAWGGPNGAVVRTVDTAALGTPLVTLTGVYTEVPAVTGEHIPGCGPDPAVTPDHVGPAGTIVSAPGLERRVALAWIASDSMPIHVTGDANAAVMVVGSFGTLAPLALPGYDGLLFAVPQAGVPLFAGVMPTSGAATVEFSFAGPALPAHFGRVPVFVQALFVAPAGGLALSNVATTVLL